MESMLNKLRSTVSSVASSAASNAVSIASQVSNYLPGNPVTREYEATAHIASAGRGLMWKVYKGYKKSTKQEASIFLFEKRQLDKWSRQERELMLDKMRKGVSQLTRLRHPQVLTVEHPLEESRDTLAFAAEPVHSSLANVLGNHENMPSPLPSNLKDYKFYDIEIKYGLLQISEGLGFLHNSVKIVHLCICPENIVLNHQGAWKLFGFDFCIANQSPPDQPPLWPFEDYDTGSNELSQPDMDYLAPEYALTHKLDPSADMFSFGILIHALYNNGKPVFENHRDFAIFKQHATELKNTRNLALHAVPDALRDQVRLMLNATPQLRPDALQFSKITYFDDIGVKTLNYLDQMFQWDNMQKSQFYKSLPQILPQLPHRVLLLRVVPCLVKECLNPTMVPFVLPVILQVAEKASKEEFVSHILAHLKPIMKITEPIQVMLLLMTKMDLLLTKTPAEDIRTDVLPLLYRALECDTQQIQELCLSVLPICAPMVDQPTMKNALLPRIKKLCVSTNYLSVRVNCLVCIGKVLEHLDRWLVMDDIFPFLEKVPSKEAPVVMAMVGIFKMSLYHKKLGISKEILATKVLPFLFPLSIENSLTPSQHSSVMALIRDMTERVETEHRVKLEHLNSIRNEQKSLEMAMPTAVPPSDSFNSNSAVPPDLFSNSDVRSSTSMNSLLNSSRNSPTMVMTTSDLSLEEKQRLAKQQNHKNSFANSTPLLPSPPQPSNPVNRSSTKPATTNNTASLIGANLNDLSLSKLSNTVIGKTENQMNGINNGSTFGNWHMTTVQKQNTSSGASSTNINWGPQPSNDYHKSQNPPPFLFNQQPSSIPNSPPHQHFSQYHTTISPTASQQFVNHQSSSNMNLHASSVFRPSFNASYSPVAPLQPTSASHNIGLKNSEFKPLSSSDIKEFLS